MSSTTGKLFEGVESYIKHHSSCSSEETLPGIGGEWVTSVERGRPFLRLTAIICVKIMGAPEIPAQAVRRGQ